MKPPSVLIVALFTGLAFAGCLDGVDPDEDRLAQRRSGRAPAPAFNDTFIASLPDGSTVDASLLAGVPALHGAEGFIGERSFEPTIGINKEGHLYVVAFDNGIPKIRVSRDEGQTWSETQAKLPSGQTNPPQSNDPFVYVDRETGRVFTSDLQALACSWMNYSDDGGRTWTTNPMGCGSPPGVHDHQSVAVGKSRGGGAAPSTWQGRMVYYCINRVGDSSCSVSPNGGLTFGPLLPVMPGVDAERGGLCGGLTGHVKTDLEGRVFLAKNQCGVPTVAVSENDGQSWRVVPITRAVGVRDHDVEIATDAAHNVYAFWISDAGIPTLSKSVDHGRTWSAPIRVAPPGVTAAALAAIAAGGEGRVAIAYIGTTIDKGYRAQATDWPLAIWHGYLGVIPDALSEAPITLTTIVDSESDPLARKWCVAGTDDRCAGMGDFIDIAIDPKGRPWAAFVDVCHAACLKSGNNESRNAQGVVGTLASGPSLMDGTPLPGLVALSTKPRS